MSNKMLAKRLLATGMSIAMSASLFMTNGLTTYAVSDEEGYEEEVLEEPEELPDEEEPEAYEDDFPPYEDEEDYHEESGETYTYTDYHCDGTKDVYTYTDVNVQQNEYYSDVNDVAENGAQGNDNVYEKVERDQINKETDKIDYIEVSLDEAVETNVYLIDKETNETAKGQDAEGNEVDVVLPDNFTRRDLIPVDVVIDEDGNIDELTLGNYSREQLVYGDYDEDGNFIEVKRWHPGVKTFIKNAEDLTPTETVYYYYNNWGRKVYVDEEVYKVLSGEESDKYTKVVEYTFENTVYSTDENANNTKEDLENNDKIKEVTDWDYTTKEVPEEKLEGWYAIAGITRAVISGDPIEEGRRHATYPIDVYAYDWQGNEFVVKTTLSTEKGKSVGDKVTIAIAGYTNNAYKPGEKEKTVDALVTVKDEDGEIVWQGTKEDYEAIKTATYTEYQGKYKVELKEKDEEGKPQYAYVDKEAYDILHDTTYKYEVTNSYYYTVQDKNEAREVEVTIGDETYNLTVNFWQNKRIGITNVDVIYPEEGDPYLAITYTYSAFEYGEYVAKTETLDDPELTTVTVDSFGSTGKGTMNIKYTPAYLTDKTESFFRQTRDREIVALDYRTNAVMPPQFRMLLSDVEGYVPEELDDIWDDGNYHASRLFGPMVKIAPVEEPVPGPTPGPTPEEPTPEAEPDDFEYPTPATEEVFFTTLAAAGPAGQVLGEQRPLAADGAAVLGASRARGTADETTAPIARVLVMAAVACAALFLTRKREENN